jgi:hypothetical protein
MKKIAMLTLLPLLLAAPAIAQTCGPEQFTTPPDNIRVGDMFEVERRNANWGWVLGWVKGTDTVVGITKDDIVVNRESGKQFRFDRSWNELVTYGPYDRSPTTFDEARPVMSFPLTVGKKWERNEIKWIYPRKSGDLQHGTVSVSSEVLGFEVIEVPGIGKVCTAHILASLSNSLGFSGKVDRWYAAELGYIVKIDSRFRNIQSLRVIGYRRGDVTQ